MKIIIHVMSPARDVFMYRCLVGARARAYRAIVEKGKDAQPRRGEEHYARLFKELRVDIETWMAKQAKANGSQDLSEAVERTILGKLAAFGTRGQWSADFLNTNRIFRAWYFNTRARIQLGRHIVAAILFDRVFAPFAFGLPEELANALAWVERDINVRGLYPLTLSLILQSRNSVEFLWFINPWDWEP